MRKVKKRVIEFKIDQQSKKKGSLGKWQFKNGGLLTGTCCGFIMPVTATLPGDHTSLLEFLDHVETGEKVKM